MEERLKVLGLSVVEVAEGCCEGCKGEQWLIFDADCYQHCGVFMDEVKRLEEYIQHEVDCEL